MIFIFIATSITDWGNLILSAISLVLTVIIILFAIDKDWIKEIRYGDKLLCSWDKDDSACFQVFNDSHILRLKITNTSKIIVAKDLKIMLISHNFKRHDEEKYRKSKLFMPMHFKWMHVNDTTYNFLAPQTSYYCDFGQLGNYPATRTFFVLDSKENIIKSNLNNGMKSSLSELYKNGSREYHDALDRGSQFALNLSTENFPLNGASFILPGKHIIEFQIYTNRGIKGRGCMRVEIPNEDEFKSISGMFNPRVTVENY